LVERMTGEIFFPPAFAYVRRASRAIATVDRDAIGVAELSSATRRRQEIARIPIGSS